MTEKQGAVLTYLRQVAADGQAPTQVELAAQFGISRNAARNHIVALRRRGLIAVEAKVARGISVTERGIARLQEAP
jgi:DNA-binding FadR family transcriptional regulator